MKSLGCLKVYKRLMEQHRRTVGELSGLGGANIKGAIYCNVEKRGDYL